MMPPTSIDGTDITGATIDGTDVTEITVDGDTVFQSSQVAEAGLYWIENLDGFAPELVEVATPYDWTTEISTTTMSFLGTTRSGTSLRPDGLRLYNIDTGADTITQFDMITPFDVGNATSAGNTAISVTTFSAPIFNPAGTKLYVNVLGGDIKQFSVSPAWDISGGITLDTTETVPTSGNNLGNISFNQDGTRIYYGFEGEGSDVYQAELSTAFDLSTMGNVTSFNTGTADPVAMAVSEDGNRLYTGHFSPDNVFQFDLSTPFDITTGSNKTQIRPDTKRNLALYSHIPPHYTNASGF